MNTFAKILVVFVLLLSSAFAVSQMMLYSKREHWRGKYEQAQKNYEATKTLADSKEKALSETQGLLQIKTTDLTKVTKELADTKKDRDDQIRALDEKRKEIELKLNERDQNVTALLKRVDAQTAAIDDLKAEAGKRQAEVTEALAKVQQLEGSVQTQKDQIEGLNKQIADLNEKNTAAANEITTLKGTLAEIEKRAPGVLQGIVSPPPIDATVARVDNAHGAVVLNKGSKDKVSQAIAFTVYRGQEFIAKVNVVEVQDDYSLAQVDKRVESKPIQVGDSASTQIQ